MNKQSLTYMVASGLNTQARKKGSGAKRKGPDPFAVACPTCGELVGTPCVRLVGRAVGTSMQGVVHGARKRAVERGTS